MKRPRGSLLAAMPVAVLSASMALAALPMATMAQSLPTGVHVGMSADELRAAGLDLERVRRPERMPGGALGLWSQANVPGDDGLSFDVTYFMRGPVLDRVELTMTAAPEGAAAAYERIVGSLREQFGAELRSRSSSGTRVDETASWAVADEDVAAYLSGPKDAEKVRIMYKRRAVKDASTL